MKELASKRAVRERLRAEPLRKLHPKEWRAWKSLMSRRAERGYPIAAAWLEFTRFLRDVGPCPEPKKLYGLLRRELHIGYVPGNVYWGRLDLVSSVTSEIAYTENEVAFLTGMDQYKRDNRRPFPELREVLRVVESLGWRRVAGVDELPKFTRTR